MKPINIIDNRISFLKPILECLQNMYLQYNSQYSTDSLYWYNERANIGAFASAIWQSGGLALEEYGADKGDEKATKKGRIDLFFRFDGHNVLSEAKLLWLRCPRGRKRNFGIRVKDKLDSACSDTRKSLLNTHYMGLGLLFVLPYWKDGDDATNDLMDVETAVNTSDSHFIMTYSNKSGNIVSSKKNAFKKVYVLGKIVEKSIP